MKLICDQHKICKHRFICGATTPHIKCEECNNCPMNENARCIPVSEEKEKS